MKKIFCLTVMCSHLLTNPAYADFCGDVQRIVRMVPNNFEQIIGQQQSRIHFTSRVTLPNANDCAIWSFRRGNEFTCTWPASSKRQINQEAQSFAQSVAECFPGYETDFSDVDDEFIGDITGDGVEITIIANKEDNEVSLTVESD